MSSCRLEPSREIPKRSQGVPDSKPDIQIDLLTDVRCPFSLLSCIGCEHLMVFFITRGRKSFETARQKSSQSRYALRECMSHGLCSQMACEGYAKGKVTDRETEVQLSQAHMALLALVGWASIGYHISKSHRVWVLQCHVSYAILGGGEGVISHW